MMIDGVQLQKLERRGWYGVFMPEVDVLHHKEILTFKGVVHESAITAADLAEGRAAYREGIEKAMRSVFALQDEKATEED